MNGMGSHQSAKMLTDVWLTPPEIIKDLGPFDLDPCAPVNRPWDTAKIHYTIQDNGLNQIWSGFIWCNPPYGNQTGLWLEKMRWYNGIALIFARTETKMFHDYVWSFADSLFFFEGRLHFHTIDGKRSKLNAGAPSVLIGYGEEATKRLEKTSLRGKFIRLSENR